MSVEAGDSGSSGFPRIVRLLPTRFSRDPKSARTTENTAAGLLLAATVIAILWANSPWSEGYWALLNTRVGFSFGDVEFDLTVKNLINDGLMTFFFFIVGLEVMAEFTIGELTDRARAAVPVVAAIAGLAVPALIFLLINSTGDNADAWGVVISTDTAFLIGALAIINPKFPARLRLFLLTLAVVDDIGALTVIALFYSHGIRIAPLMVAAVLIVAIALVRYLPVGRGPAYAVSGFALWVALYTGGVHPTVGGCGDRTAIPVFTPERRQVGAGRRADPRVPAITELGVCPRSEPRSAGVDLDQRAVADPVRALRVVPGASAVRVGERRGEADRRNHLGGHALTADMGNRRRPRPRQVHRDHWCDMAGAALRLGSAGARA